MVRVVKTPFLARFASSFQEWADDTAGTLFVSRASGARQGQNEEKGRRAEAPSPFAKAGALVRRRTSNLRLVVADEVRFRPQRITRSMLLLALSCA